MIRVEMLSNSHSHTLLLSHQHTRFRSRSKHRQPLIVSVSKIHHELHEKRIIQKPSKRKESSISTSTSTRVESTKPSSHLPLLEKIFIILDRAIARFLDPDPSLGLSVYPEYILSDNWAPVDEIAPTECRVIHGTIPESLNGVYLRNGPNPQFPPTGPHHYFDGDGMVHCVRISDHRVTFCSRYVKTNKYLSENQARSCVVPNVIGGMYTLTSFIARAALFSARVVFGGYDITKGIGVANTSLALLGGKLYALCESDIPYAIKIEEDGDVTKVGQDDFNGGLSTNMTAHVKIDPDTNEAFAFRYWATRPYLTYFRFDADGNKQPDVPIHSMKHQSLTHDLAITGKYAVFCDIQIGACPVNVLRGERFVGVDRGKVPRIGVVPRYARDESEMKWFEVAGFNVFHTVNAWDERDEEEGGEVVVMVAPNVVNVEGFFDRPDEIRGSMEKVRIHMETGVVTREIMSTENLEFPVINPSYIGKKNRYVYATVASKTESESKMMRALGVIKLDVTVSQGSGDHSECVVGSRMYESNCFGGEPFFVARDPKNPECEEDDGYLVSYVHDEGSGESRFVVMDARSPTLEVVAVVKLPQRVPYGLHGLFIRDSDLNKM